MRILIIFLCSFLLLCSCHSESKPAGEYTLYKPADSLIKFVTLDFELDGKLCKAAINQNYLDFTGKKEFPLSLFITINTVEKDSISHPTSRESRNFDDLEDLILSQLGPATKYCYVGRTTMNGYRDMIFYIPSTEQKKITDILNSIRQKHSRIKSFVFEDDPEWESVAEFYAAIKKR